MFRGLRELGSGLLSAPADVPSFEEAFRVLRSNLTVALADMAKPTVVVTSANSGEGKTTACCQLGLAFAAAGQRVIVVDLDLRHAGAHRVLGGHNEFGASEVLLGHRSLQEALQYVEPIVSPDAEAAGLYFLAAGGWVDNPADVLAGGRTARLLESLSDQADIVLIDTPAVLPVADTLVVGRIASGALLVTEVGRTAMEAVEKAKDLLVRNHTRLLGVMINKYSRRSAGDRSVGFAVAGGFHEPGAMPSTNGVSSTNGSAPGEF